jgi:hypothetical protein
MRSTVTFLFFSALGRAAVLGACGGGTVTGGTSADAGSDVVVTPTDLPCDVAALVQSKCQSCHGAPPTANAPMPLVSYADLTAKSATDPTKTYAELSVARMQNATSPMPPGTKVSPPADVAVLAAWISTGYPMGTCGGADAGLAPVICTSGQTANTSERVRPAELMHPGGACNTCHRSEREGPQFAIAGTLYPTLHEADDCWGSSGGATGAKVLILDKDGNTQVTLTPNLHGNFYSYAPPFGPTITYPYTAKVVVGTKELAMTTPQMDGDCNSCHTEQGANGAPGRITVP